MTPRIEMFYKFTDEVDVSFIFHCDDFEVCKSLILEAFANKGFVDISFAPQYLWNGNTKFLSIHFTQNDGFAYTVDLYVFPILSIDGRKFRLIEEKE